MIKNKIITRLEEEKKNFKNPNNSFYSKYILFFLNLNYYYI